MVEAFSSIIGLIVPTVFTMDASRAGFEVKGSWILPDSGNAWAGYRLLKIMIDRQCNKYKAFEITSLGKLNAWQALSL